MRESFHISHCVVCVCYWGTVLLVAKLKFLESYAYFSMSLILTLYLSEFGYNDYDAGWMYGIFGTLTSAYGIVVGFVIDNLGVRWSLVLGSALLTVGRLLIAITKSRLLIQIMLYTVLPLGSALGIPVMMTGIRYTLLSTQPSITFESCGLCGVSSRYTNDTNRSFGFSLFYSVMNIAGNHRCESCLSALTPVLMIHTSNACGLSRRCSPQSN